MRTRRLALLLAAVVAGCGSDDSPDAGPVDGAETDGVSLDGSYLDGPPDAFVADAGRPSGWTAAAPIEEEAAAASGVELGADGAGVVIAAWLQGEVSATTLRTRVRDAAGAWGPQTTLTAADSRPSLAVNAAGQAVLVWTAATTGGDGVWASRYASGAWSTPAFVGPRYVSDVHAAIGPDGAAIAVWSQELPGGGVTLVASRATGEAWSAPSSVNGGAGGVRMFSGRVSALSGGRARAVWVQGSGTSYQVLAAELAPASGWGAPVTLGPTYSYGAKPAIATDGADRTTVAWSQREGSIDHLHARRAEAGSGWDADTRLDGAASRGVFVPWIAADAAGTVHVVWAQKEDASAFGLWTRRRTAGGAWEEPVRLGDGGSGIYNVRAGVDGSGNVVAMWDREDPVSEIVEAWAAARPANGGWESPGPVSELGSSAFEPRLAVGGTWRAVVAFERDDVSGRTIDAAVLAR